MIKEVKKKECHDSDCDILFIPFKSTDKFCSWECFKKNQKPRKPTETKPIPKMSDKRKKETALYLKKRAEFLNLPENKICPVTNKSTTEVHHKKGRVGSLYLDERYWLAVSHEGHKRIELNPDWAKENGYSLNRL